MATQQQVKDALQTPAPKGKSNPLAARLKKELEAQIGSKKKLLEKVKESRAVAGRVGMKAVNKTEFFTTAFVGSLIDGRLGARADGKRKIQIMGKVDARAPLAILGELADLWLTATDSPAASHVGAIADGLAAPVLVRWGVEAGEAWSRGSVKTEGVEAGEAWSRGSVKTEGAGDEAAGDDDPDLSGVREMALTESTLGDETPENNRWRQVQTG